LANPGVASGSSAARIAAWWRRYYAALSVGGGDWGSGVVQVEPAFREHALLLLRHDEARLTAGKRLCADGKNRRRRSKYRWRKPMSTVTVGTRPSANLVDSIEVKPSAHEISSA
jgi:hypothetical protein